MGKSLIIKGADFSENGIQQTLTDVAYENYTYQDLFETNNILGISSGFENGSYAPLVVSAGAPTISNTDSDSGTYSLKCDGTTSQQLRMSTYLQSQKMLFAAVRVKCTEYTQGCIGVVLRKNTAACVDYLTDGYETKTALDTVSFNSGIFVGSALAANLKGNIDNPVVIDMSIFDNAPGIETLTRLYNTYVQILKSE